MNEKVFQNVFDKIQDYLPVDWEQVIFFAGYTAGSYSINFYFKSSGGEYIDCFSLSSVTKPMLTRLFIEIDKILTEERNILDEKNRWTVFTMKVNSKGNMKTEFDYSDHSADMISYEKEWKKKYL